MSDAAPKPPRLNISPPEEIHFHVSWHAGIIGRLGRLLWAPIGYVLFGRFKI